MLGEQECLSHSAAAQRNFLASEAYLRASVLALYAPIHNEVQTAAIFDRALRDGKTVCFPRVSGEGLDFVAVAGPGDLSPGAFGIGEPRGTQVVAVTAIDTVVMPGIGFDRCGYRLGYGGGYYDRAIGTACPAELVGLAYDFQLVDELPTEEHDIRLDRIVAPSEVLAFETNI